MKKLILTIFIASTLIAQKNNFSQKADSVLALMTLEEKVGQLVQYSGSWKTGTDTGNDIENTEDAVRKGKLGSLLNFYGAEKTKELQKIAVQESRMKIPLLFGLDVIHGFISTFPVPIAEASSWNPELVKKSAQMQALEASAVGLHWTFNPMVDIARDPRWGRIMEGSGEDAYLGSVMAVARVQGYQGNDLSADSTILACVKHYAAYGAAEGGRDYNTVDLSERNLREFYLPPYKAAVDAGAGSLMASFNEIGGVPSSASKFLMTDILRNEWKSDAFVVSDWNSIGEMVAHGNAKDLQHATDLAIKASIDMDMESNGYNRYLVGMVNDNTVDIKFVDEAVKRILIAKFKLGLFCDPLKYSDTKREKKILASEKVRQATKEVALESIVLLKNKSEVLPLNKNLKSIAVVGSLADAKYDPLGNWEAIGDSNLTTTILAGIKNKVGKNVKVSYAKGCSVTGNDKSNFEAAVKIASSSEIVIAVVGEKRNMSGEAYSRATLNLPGVQEELLRELKKTGKKLIAVLMNGRPLTINWLEENADAIVETWFPGISAGDAVADILFGDCNPSAKLPVTFPRHVGQIPLYYNHKNTGRPYNSQNHYTSGYFDMDNSPIYPFGFGLSYTTFKYSDLKLSKKQLRIDDSLKISIIVENTGKYDGKEIVQLYIQDLVGSVTRPVKELKDFKKIFLRVGEKETVEFVLTTDKLKFYDINMNYVVEPGAFKLFIGKNSEDFIEENFEIIN